MKEINAIFEACSFQDVTGQRIRRAIQHLQQVETMLTDIMPGECGSVAGGNGGCQRAVRRIMACRPRSRSLRQS